MRKDPGERLLEWSEKIKQQKLSAMTEGNWCQEQGISYNTFQYWKAKLKKLNDDNLKNLKKNAFIEIPEELPLIEISLRGIKMTIFKDFDRNGLIHFLNLLKS